MLAARQPELENVAASSPVLEKASGGQRGGIYHSGRCHGAVVENAATNE
jgi:hypothetical protein